MNKLFLMGRLTRDPEIRYGQGENQMAIARFSLAVDRRFKRAGDTASADFFNCTAFGKQAEFAERYLKQGSKILLAGRVQNDHYTNRDGQKVFSVQVIAEEMEFAESKRGTSETTGVAEDDDRRRTQHQGVRDPDGFADVDRVEDEELPWN